ncbi:MAG: oligoendopeptidase F [Gemmiger sp.]|nr:oligoendopeptidase F [Gemmiger sp.]
MQQENKIVPERGEIDPQYQWDLTPLYPSDAAWEADFAGVDADIDALPAFAGTLSTAQAIHAYLAAETALLRRLSNLYCYASLRRSEDTRADAAQSMFARVSAKYVRAGAVLSFAQPEILALPAEKLAAIVEDAALADYHFALSDLLRRKAHTLSAPEEKLLAAMGEVAAAPSEIADNLQDADMVFADAENQAGERVPVTGSGYIVLQSSTDRTLRKNAFHSFYEGYRQHSNTFAAAYAGAVKAALFESQARHYPSSRAMSMAGENIPETVYDNLVATVRAHLPAMHRYAALRKEILGLDALHYYDLYAPLVPNLEIHYTYPEAQQMVLDAVAPLGEGYQAQVKEAFAQRWLDVYPNKGKSGGAYSSGTYDSRPYILTNFTGTLDAVSTIAHEMGHSMHTAASNRTQPPQYADYTLFVAEVASTVNENLMIEQLLKGDITPEMRLYLLNQYLENFKGTVYRQTMFAEFERDAHAMAQRGEALSPAALNALYKGLVADYFGPALAWDDAVQYEWARIPHFYRPFYVYKYATGYSTAVALSEGILANGAPAVKKYLEFLSMGGSAYPLEELKHAGVDLATPAPVEAALQKFERILDEAEQVYREISAKSRIAE